LAAFLAGAFFFVATQFTSSRISVGWFASGVNLALLLLLGGLLGCLLLRRHATHLLSWHRLSENSANRSRAYFFFLAAFLAAFFFVAMQLTPFRAGSTPLVRATPTVGSWFA
jgi:hypothetical protein